MSGKWNPYGKLGVIEECAMADILIYSKNPLEDVSVVEDYGNNLKLAGQYTAANMATDYNSAASLLDADRQELA